MDKNEMSLVVVDQSSVRVMVRTQEMEFELETWVTLGAKFYVIPSKGLEQLWAANSCGSIAWS